MASSTRRLSRKELRQPDWFQTTTENALASFERHRVPVYLGIGAIILLFVGIWGWRAFKEHQDSSAAQEFSQALIQYHAGKHREAIAALEKVQSYRWSKYSNLAHLYEANSYLALNELAKAANAAQRFIVGTTQNSLMRQIGLLTLAAIEERKSQCSDAIKHYVEASKIKAALMDRALFNQARCAVHMNDIQAAIAAYRQLLKDEPESASAGYITFRIGELEAKLAAGPAAN
jgi:predicted negative regulator of RcsB-dependent stress response